MWCETIVNELVKRGVTYFIISPGSRSTPLTLAVARHPETTHVIAYDERGAAYQAVGYARATTHPAALICTSGTAAANYLPAIAEASNDAVPLIAITADRPPELQGIGANQTMNQQHLYGDFVRHFINLPPEEDGMPAMAASEAVATAIGHSLAPLAGPVHINCMLREPFDYTASTPDETAPTEHPARPAAPLDETALASALALMASAERGIVVVGHLATPEAREAVASLAEALAWPVWADIRSGLHNTNDFARDRCALERVFLTPPGRPSSPPDLILHLGGNVVSKHLLEYIQNDFSGEYIRAADDIRNLDPTRRATLMVDGALQGVCNAMLPHADALRSQGLTLSENAAFTSLTNALREESADDTTLSEPSIGYLLSQHLPQDFGLLVGNSMPIRFCDRFAIGDKLPAMVAANRGVSGIDGTIATAAGFRAGLSRPIVCLLGDVSFIHDMNSLSQIACSQHPLILLVVNNSGGGIFHHLPIAGQADVFEEFFVTPHSYQFEDVARQFSLPYTRAETNGEFVTQLREAIGSGSHAVIELTVDQQTNMQVYERLEKPLRASSRIGVLTCPAAPQATNTKRDTT